MPRNRGSKRGSKENKQGGTCDRTTAKNMKLTERSNNPAWYAKNNQLLYDAASLPFSQSIGPGFRNFEGHLLDYTQTSHTLSDAISIPGIFRISFLPVPGYSDSATSPINVSAFDTYTWVRHKNSGSSNYNAPDLMLYIMAMDQVYIAISEMRRAYKIARSYSMYNTYYPLGLLKALEWDADAVISNMAQFREYINTLTAMASRMCVPNTMPLIQRHSWMCENVYADSSSHKAQSYVYHPTFLAKYNPTLSSEGGGLEYISLPSPRTPENMFGFVQNMLRPIIGDEDFNIMSGDIRKAYDSLITLTELQAGDYLTPVYDEEVLSQIHNTTTVMAKKNNNPSSNTVLEVPNITQTQGSLMDGPYLLWDPKTNQVAVDRYLNLTQTHMELAFRAGMKYLINSRFDAPTPEWVMVASRNMTAIRYEASGDTAIRLVCGSEWFTDFTVFRFSVANGNLASISVPSYGLYPITDDGVVHMPGDSNGAIWSTTQFDWHPILYLGQINVLKVEASSANLYSYNWTNLDAGVSGVFDVDYVGDLNNFSVISVQTIEDLHRIALLSEFDVSTKV